MTLRQRQFHSSPTGQMESLKALRFQMAQKHLYPPVKQATMYRLKPRPLIRKIILRKL